MKANGTAPAMRAESSDFASSSPSAKLPAPLRGSRSSLLRRIYAVRLAKIAVAVTIGGFAEESLY